MQRAAKCITLADIADNLNPTLGKTLTLYVTIKSCADRNRLCLMTVVGISSDMAQVAACYPGLNVTSAHPRFRQMMSSGPGAACVSHARRSWCSMDVLAMACAAHKGVGIEGVHAVGSTQIF